MWKVYALPAILFALDVIALTQGQILQLERIQRELFRKLLCLPQHTKTVVLYAETGTRPLRYDIIQSTLNTWSRIKSLPKSRLVRQALDLQEEKFAQNGWDIVLPPAETGPAAVPAYRNCHFFIKRAIECAEALGWDLTHPFAKLEIKQAVARLWSLVFWRICAESPTLHWYNGRREHPVADPYLNLHSDAAWWLKTRAGSLIRKDVRQRVCACGKALLSEVHLLFECPTVHRAGWAWNGSRKG